MWAEHVIDNSTEGLHGTGIADMDKDGDLDVVAAEWKGLLQVSVFFNQGKGAVWKQQVIATTGSHNIRVADIGKDGDWDIFGAMPFGSPGLIELWENQLR